MRTNEDRAGSYDYADVPGAHVACGSGAVEHVAGVFAAVGVQLAPESGVVQGVESACAWLVLGQFLKFWS